MIRLGVIALFFLFVFSSKAQERRITVDSSYELELRDNLIALNIIHQDDRDTFVVVNCTDGCQLPTFYQGRQNCQFIVETDKYLFVSKYPNIHLVDSDYVIRFKRYRGVFSGVYYNLQLFENVSATGRPIYIKRYLKTKRVLKMFINGELRLK